MQSSQSAMQQVAPYLTLGVQLAATVVACGALGWWIDTMAVSEPIGLVSGVALGSVVGLVQFIRTVLRLTRRDKEASKMKQER